MLRIYRTILLFPSNFEVMEVIRIRRFFNLNLVPLTDGDSFGLKGIDNFIVLQIAAIGVIDRNRPRDFAIHLIISHNFTGLLNRNVIPAERFPFNSGRRILSRRCSCGVIDRATLLGCKVVGTIDLIKICQLVMLTLTQCIKVFDFKSILTLRIFCKRNSPVQAYGVRPIFRQRERVFIIATGQIVKVRDHIIDRDRLPGGAVLRRYFDRILEVGLAAFLYDSRRSRFFRFDIALLFQGEVRTVRETDIFAGTGTACNDIATDIDVRSESPRIIKIFHTIVKGNNRQTLCIHVQAANDFVLVVFIVNIFRYRLGQLIRKFIVSLVAVRGILMKGVLQHLCHIQDKANFRALLNR